MYSNRYTRDEDRLIDLIDERREEERRLLAALQRLTGKREQCRVGGSRK